VEDLDFRCAGCAHEPDLLPEKALQAFAHRGGGARSLVCGDQWLDLILGLKPRARARSEELVLVVVAAGGKGAEQVLKMLPGAGGGVLKKAGVDTDADQAATCW
jgi:hypothetical protein